MLEKSEIVIPLCFTYSICYFWNIKYLGLTLVLILYTNS